MDDEELRVLFSRVEDQLFDRTSGFEEKNKDGVGQKIAAFASSYGGVLLFGQEDNGRISGVGRPNEFIHRLGELCQSLEPVPSFDGPYFFDYEGKNLAVLKIVSLGQGGPCSYKGVAYRRVQDSVVKITPKELYRIWSTAGKICFEERVSIAPASEIDVEALELYSRNAREVGEVNEKAFLESRKLGKDNFLTNLGVLVLGKKPSNWLPNARVHVVRFKGVEAIERSAATTLSLPMHALVSSCVSFMKTFMPVRERREGIQRIEEPVIPEYVLREALVNALAHRDYENLGEVLVRIFSDRLEISNPGAPSPEEWKQILFSGIPVHRNPRIYEFLREANLGEGVGQGIPEMRKRLKDAGLPEPVFSTIRETFNISLHYKEVNESREVFLKKILDTAREEKKLTSTRVMRLLNVSRPLVIRLLDELVKQGYLTHSGGGRTSKYSFIELK